MSDCDLREAPPVRYGKPVIRRIQPGAWSMRVKIGAPYGGASTTIAPSWHMAMEAAKGYVR